jgi:ribosomal protein S18 acetylase RimI-like enzyme
MIQTLSDPALIRPWLQRDPVWAAYALGDLIPGWFEHCQWFLCGETLVLLYRGLGTPILLVYGPVDGLAEVVSALPVNRVYVSVAWEARPVLERHFRLQNAKRMHRMRLVHTPPEASLAGVRRLTATDVPDLVRLYADGEAHGESPDFFAPGMVSDGVFFGGFRAGELVSVAGTHLVAKAEGIGAIGNVYTRRDARKEGWASATVSAVARELAPLPTVILNVHCENQAAIRVYQKLGFTKHCEYWEALAERG